MAQYRIDLAACPTARSRDAASYLNAVRETHVGRCVLDAATHRRIGALLTSTCPAKRGEGIRMQGPVARAVLARLGVS